MFSCPAISFFTLLSSHFNQLMFSIKEIKETKGGSEREEWIERWAGLKTYNPLPVNSNQRFDWRASHHNSFILPFTSSNKEKNSWIERLKWIGVEFVFLLVFFLCGAVAAGCRP